ncbi:MAG: alpha-amylase/4-alpha-glucanotransferase domain-containing protein, partial [Gammaproteobacteria bacterium]
MSTQLAATYGTRPQGAWLTERVWEPTVVPALAATGLSYVTVDDYHFLCTGLTAEALDSHYTTEEGGVPLDLFPIAEGLRYRLPFAPAATAVAYLEELAKRGDRAAIYFDDIEKFGIWPETHSWVYVQGWLTQFIEGVLASPHIATSTYAEFHSHSRSRGLIYLPTTSYSEMNEWTLPPPAASRYRALVAAAQDQNRLTLDRPFLRGGIWRNFLSRYPEANWMHKRMIEISDRLAAHAESAANADCRQLLYRAQANDAYWHGLFGGLYLPHLRRSIWRNLLTLETRLPPRVASRKIDLDLDGVDEIILRSPDLLIALRDDGLSTLHEFSSFALTHNFGDTLRRSTEHYFSTIENAVATHADHAMDAGIASAHERIAFKQVIDPANLTPDTACRGLFMDARSAGAGYDAIDHYCLERIDAEIVETCASLATLDTQLHKTFRLQGADLIVSYHTAPARSCRMLTRIHLALPSCDGFGGRYRLADGTI